jgi:hypothetical protein
MAYATNAELRALDGLADESVYPDATLTQAIAWAESVIDRATGTSYEYKAFTVTLDGSGGSRIRVIDEDGQPVLFLRTLTAVTIDGVALEDDPADWAGWALRPEGVIVRDSGVFPTATVGRNVVLAGTAGQTSTAPAPIAWAARTLARQWLVDLHSRIPDRALQLQSEFGTIQFAQAGGRHGPTSLPEVNAVLMSPEFHHRAPAIG